MRRRTTREPWARRDDDRVRVLLECEPHSSPSIIASVIERHGFAVRTCEGPSFDHCDLLEGGACALVDDADVVVNMLRSRDRDVLAELAGRDPAPAVVAEMTHAQASGAAGSEPGAGAPPYDLDRITVVETPVNTRALIEAINEAVGRSVRPALPAD